MSIKVELTVKEIHEIVCQDCKKLIAQLVKKKIDADLVAKVLEA